MSGTVLTLLMTMAAQAPSDEPASVDAIMANTRRLTSVERPCVYDRNSTDITVCGRRNADRFRVPFVPPPEPGDPKREGVMAERTRLLARTTPIDEMSPFLVNGGFTGVTMDTNPRDHGPTLRKPAP
ncbi:hypothetical protein ACQKJZ_12165 [Sphingomonas sp. NPDC019816]|uniref:hypothetical protein n=1 Tax=Sphingomonas sp. NPDC019816 TaxID=3390679 RepID=UPI003D01FB03